MGPSFDLQAWLETHERPFLVIDEAFRVVATNRAYEQAFALHGDAVVGRPCHEVSHQRPEPCDQAGEECPLAHARATGLPHACLHAHYDADGEVRWVRVHLYPIIAADGSRYYAEMVEEVAPQDRPAANEWRMVGRSPPFLEMVAALTSIARAPGPVLLVGETGTGKELAARFIHHHSARAGRPFLCLDCAAVPEGLCENELLGQERPASPGRGGARKGMLELVDGGTLFLDEIGEMPLALQAKLLRLLETQEAQRVGDDRPRPVDVRIVAATHHPLWEDVTTGSFREDLFHRLACFTRELPPLRDRMEDLPLIVAELLRHIPPPPGHPAYRIAQAAVAALRDYPYPGNVRELRNLLQEAAAYSPAGRIGAETIVRALGERQGRTPAGAIAATGATRPLRATPPPPAESERLYLADALARHGGHRRRTADALGISERTLYRKLKRYGLR